MSASSGTWREFKLPEDRELSSSEKDDLSARVSAKILELTGEDADSTFVEYLQVMLSNHTPMAEIASSLAEVADGDYTDELCEWLTGVLKKTLHVGPSPEEQLAIMRQKMAKLEQEKARLQQDLEKSTATESTRGPSGSSDAAHSSRKRPLEGAAQRDPRSSSAPLSPLASMYLEYLKSGAATDFATFRAAKDPKAPQPKEEQASSSNAANETVNEAAAARGAMTWSRFGDNNNNDNSYDNNKGNGDDMDRSENNNEAGNDGASKSNGDFSSTAFSSIMGGAPATQAVRGGFGSFASRGGGRGGFGGFGNRTFVKDGDGGLVEVSGQQNSQIPDAGPSPANRNMTFTRPGLEEDKQNQQQGDEGDSNYNDLGNNDQEGQDQSESSASKSVWGAGAMRGNSTGFRGASNSYFRGSSSYRGAPYRGRGGGSGGGFLSRGRGRGGFAPPAHKQWVRSRDTDKEQTLSQSLPATP